MTVENLLDIDSETGNTKIQDLTERLPITTPEDKLNEDVTGLSASVLDFKIEDKFTYELSLQYLVPLADMRKRVTKYFKALRDPIKEGYDKSIAKNKKEEALLLNPVVNAENYIRQERVKYKTEQDRIDEKERLKVEAKAKKKADKERDKLLEKAANAPEEKQEALFEKAEEVYVSPFLIEKTVEKQARTPSGATASWIKDIAVTVSNVKLLCGAVAAGKAPESIVIFKQVKSWVKLHDIQPGEIPGLDIKETQREVVR